MSDALTPKLAAFAAGPVSTTETVRRITAMSCLDWVAVGRAGVNEPVARITREIALDEAGEGVGSIFGSTRTLPARAAALVNGTTSHALDYDDTHFAHIGHPSVAVFPAALAVAEREDRAVLEMLEAAVVGMEVSVRIGIWLGRTHYQTGFHQTATSGAFGAAIAAARLLGLTAEQIKHVMGLTATRAAGLKAQFGTMGKPYNAGLAATAGVETALLVASGFEANPDALEGPFGFGATHHGEAVPEALDDLGETWLMEDVNHKFHACCHGLHAALEAARQLDIAAPEIAEMTVRTNPRWMSVCNQSEPTTGLGAKFSYATVLAMRALGHDTARLESFSDIVCEDPRIKVLRRKIKVIPDDHLSELQAELTVLRRDGATLEASYDLAAPMTLDDRESRVREKASSLMGVERSDATWALLQQGGSARIFGHMLGEKD